jgi:hypothetical protein
MNPRRAAFLPHLSPVVWIEPYASDPIRLKPGILARRYVAARVAAAGEQEFAGPFGSSLESSTA